MAMLRLASSKVVPSTLRAISTSPRLLSQSISSVLRVSTVISPNCLSHSTNANKSTDQEFAEIMSFEIRSKQSLEETIPVAPADFPFRIEDHSYNQYITLTREIDGEKIAVIVTEIAKVGGEESEYSDGDSGDDESSSTDISSDEENEESEAEFAPCVDLFVIITKENGKRFNLTVSASAHQIRVSYMWYMEPITKAHQIRVSCMSIMDPATKSDAGALTCFGKYFVHEESDLECGLREFLEHRGIKKSYFGFLYNYMLNKSKRHTLLLLTKLKDFIKD